MPWVRFDDQFTINRKVTRLSDAAFRQHVSAIFWCARNLTDGVVPEEDLDDVCARVRTPERFVTELLDRGLWHVIGTQCESEECPAHADNAISNSVTRGWVIHDYLAFQPSKEQVLTDRKGNAERQKKWREARKAAEEKRNGVSNGASNRGSNAAPARPGPSSSPDGDEQTDSTSPSRDNGRGTRLPDDFPVTAEMAAWAREKAPTCGDPDHEAFCDYWRAQPGAKGRKADWIATWRNWMRRAHDERAGRTARTSPPPAARRSTTDERVAAAQALKSGGQQETERPHPLIKIMGEIVG